MESRTASSSARGGVKIHHLGIAVKSLAESSPIFQKLVGKAPETEETVSDQKVRLAVFRLGESRLELLEPTENDSAIAQFLLKRGPGIHHLSLTVADLRKTLRQLESEGMKLIDREPRVGANNEQIAFLHPSSTGGVLIELIEDKSCSTGI